MEIGKKIKIQRIQKDLKQKDLARMAGISNTYLSDIENGRTNPSLKTLLRITHILDMNITDLVNNML